MAKSDNNLTAVFTDIANAIRNKTGNTATMTPRDFADGIMAIATSSEGGTGIDTSDATATPSDILLDKTAYANGEKIVGTIQTYNNEHENGYGQINALKKLLDTTKSAMYLFRGYTGTSVDDLISYSDTENVTNMSDMFGNCSNLQAIPLLNTSKVTNMSSIFWKCSNLTTIPQLNTSNVTDIHSIFEDCSNLQTIPLLNTINVTNMVNMFAGCSNLQAIPQLDTSNVTRMGGMFFQCSKLKNIPQLDTSNVTDMSHMFWKCSNLQTIPQLDTINVTNMSYMFSDCSNLQTIPQLNTSKVTNMSDMFGYCKILQTIDLTHMNITRTSYSSEMCYACSSLTKFIIRNMDTIPALNLNAFDGCYHFTGTVHTTYNPDGLKDGRIYVPDDKVAQLKQAKNWSNYADIIVPLSTLVE